MRELVTLAAFSLQVGTILEIRHIEYLPDGRSILDTRGSRRFKVLERAMRDGYNTAKVEYITDQPVPEERLPGESERMGESASF